MKKQKGFTLIELLVVISIIGMLSSIVLASVSSARDKGKLAAAMQFDSHTYSAFGADALGIWEFDGNALDSSGNNKNGSVFGATYTTDYRGNSNRALSFDGSSNYVNVGVLDVSNNITVSAWVYSTNFNQNGVVIAKNPVNSQWELFFESGYVRWRGGSPYFNNVYCSVPANNTWHNVAATQSGTKASIYIDGQLCGTGMETAIADGLTPVTNDVEIGRFTSFYYFNGKIDGVRVYSQSLVSSDIQKIYAEGLKNHQLAIKAE